MSIFQRFSTKTCNIHFQTVIRKKATTKLAANFLFYGIWCFSWSDISKKLLFGSTTCFETKKDTKLKPKDLKEI